jgi:hypothetical protein
MGPCSWWSWLRLQCRRPDLIDLDRTYHVGGDEKGYSTFVGRQKKRECIPYPPARLVALLLTVGVRTMARQHTVDQAESVHHFFFTETQHFVQSKIHRNTTSISTAHIFIKDNSRLRHTAWFVDTFLLWLSIIQTNRQTNKSRIK